MYIFMNNIVYTSVHMCCGQACIEPFPNNHQITVQLMKYCYNNYALLYGGLFTGGRLTDLSFGTHLARR